MFLNPMLFAAALFTTPATPQTVVDDLLNVDRSFSSAAAATDPASGLATMLDADAVTPVPGKGIVEGDRQSVVEGKSESVRVDLGGGRLIQKNKQQRKNNS